MRAISRRNHSHSALRRLVLWVTVACLQLTQGARAEVTSRCTESDSPRLCVQRLRATPEHLQLLVTLTPKDGSVQLAEGLQLSLDDQPLTLTGTRSSESLKEPIDVIAVVQQIGVAASSWSPLQQGLASLADAIERFPDSRLGLMGYSDTKTLYYPDLQLGPVQTARKALQSMEPANSRATSFELYDAVGEAIKRVSTDGSASQRRRMVLIISNSQEREKQRDKLFERLAESAQHQGVVVSLVLLPGMKARPFLVKLIEATGGSIYSAAGTGELLHALEGVRAEIEQQTVATFSRPTSLTSSGSQLRSISVRHGGLSLSLKIKSDMPAVLSPLPQHATGAGSRVSAKPLWPRVRTALILVLGLGVAGVALAWASYALWQRLGTRDAQPAKDPATFSSVPAPAIGGERPTVYWVYETESLRTHLIPRFPFSIGNDIDCDLVLRGLDASASSCTLRTDRSGLLLHPRNPRGGSGVKMRGQLLERAVPIGDRCEFSVGPHRLVLFETLLS